MEKKFYVYEYYKKENDEVFYVGKGTGQRFRELRNRNPYFKSIYNKYDCEVRKIYEDLTNEEACQKEIERIAELRKVGQAKTNLTEGGTGFSVGKLNPTAKNPHYGDSNGMRTQKIDFSGEKNPFYGRKHTEETKKKISENRKGKGGLKGKDNPMYGSKRFSGENNPMYGRKGFDHPNSIMYKATYTNGGEEYFSSSAGAKKFGIAFTRVTCTDGGILHYKKKTPNDIYEGTIIERTKHKN